MEDTKRIQELILSWKAQNRKLLPLNIDSWVVKVVEITSAHKAESGVTQRTDLMPFYKSISRLIDTHNGE